MPYTQYGAQGIADGRGHGEELSLLHLAELLLRLI